MKKKNSQVGRMLQASERVLAEGGGVKLKF